MLFFSFVGKSCNVVLSNNKIICNPCQLLSDWHEGGIYSEGKRIV